MNWNYEAWLANKLKSICLELGLNIKPKVFSEREFLRKTELAPNEVGIVTRRSQSELTYGAETLPVQILAMAEADAGEEATTLLNEFAARCNFTTDPESGDVVCKHQYSAPVTLTNFESVSYGYRSVLYVNGTLVIVKGVLDVTELEIDDNPVSAIDLTVSYQMQTNTQTLASRQIASSMKTAATLAISFTVPLIDIPFVTKVLSILAGSTGGDTAFAVSFSIGSQEILSNFKMITAQVTTSRDSVPSLQVGLSV